MSTQTPQFDGCPKCRVAVRVGDRFCPQCGGALSADPHLAADVAERRVVTVLFCDLVGSTRLSQELDAEQWRELLARYHQVCGELVHAAEGHVAQYLGDGVLAYFGWPRAHEDDAARAMRCALGIVRRLNELPPLAGNTLQARLGLDSGTVIISAVGSDALRESLALGDIPNIAARVQSLAEPGTVLATDRTWQLALGYFKGTSIGHPALKGVAQPPEVWHIEGETGARSRLEAAARLSPFVGRDLQLGQALAFVNDPQPSVRLLDVVGEPGIGKSRLLAELRLMLRHSPSILVLAATCAPDRQGTPLSPFAEILRGLLGPAGQADSQAIGALLQAAALDSTERRGLLALLLGEVPPLGSLDALDSTLIGLRTRDLLLRLLVASGHQRVTVVLFEDLHWLDAASQDVLARMVALEDPVAVRLLSTRRPEYQPPWQAAGGVQVLAMPPLSAQATAQIIVARFGASLLADLVTQLATRAEGNALFAEELANYVAGAVQLSGEVPRAEALLRSMPDSVRSLLDARVDALAADDRMLLQAAAVIGRRFDVALLAELVPDVAAVPERIERLIIRDLLVRVGDGVCEFKHALTQDALYGRLLRAQAAPIHGAVARQFEHRHAGDLDSVAEALAFHWTAADQPQQAVIALTRAGRKAWGRYAIADAQRHLEAAADLVEQAPDRFAPDVVLHMLRPLVHVLYGQNEPARTMRRVERHLGLVRAHLSQRDAVYVLAWYITACCLAREYTAATELVALVWSAGAAQADPHCRGQATAAYLLVNSIAMDCAGADYPAALVEAERLCQSADDPFLVNDMMAVLAWDAWARGHHHRMTEIALQLAARGEALGDPRAEAVSLWLRGWTEFNDERFAECLQRAQRCIDISVLPFDLQMGRTLKALSLALNGHPAVALQLLDEQEDYFSRVGALYPAASLHLGRAAGLVMLGRLAPGMRTLDAAIAESTRLRDGRLLAQHRVVKAEILMSLLDPPPSVSWRDKSRLLLRNLGFFLREMPQAARRAEALLRQAQEYPPFAEPKSYWHARINVDLALLRVRKGPRNNAHALLVESRALAVEQDAQALVTKVDRALARLPA